MRYLPVTFLTGLFAWILAWSGSTTPAPTARHLTDSLSFEIGFVMNYLKAECDKQGPQPDAGVRPQDYILAQYDRPEIRQQTRAALAEMHAQGATIMRTNLGFRHAEDVEMARAPDPLGLFVASGGRLPAPKVANLVRLATDARNSGYTLFGVAIAPQGRSNPKCGSGGVYGACYDASYLGKTWSVIDQTAAALLPLRTNRFRVVFDISPENCPDGDGGALVGRNEEAFTRTMVGWFARKYGAQFFVSCGGAPPGRGLRGLEGLARIYRGTGARPALIDVHLYEQNPAAIDAEITNADGVARGLGVPLYVMETYADNAVLFAEADRLKRTHQAANLAGVMVWPLDAGAACQISISPPYDLSRILPRGKPPAA